MSHDMCVPCDRGMDHKTLQAEILSCIPAKSLIAKIEALNHSFTERDLLTIAFHYAPTFGEQLRLLGLLADHAPQVSGHAGKCISWQKNSLKQLQTQESDAIYELQIKTDPNAYEERYLCSTYEAALEMIDKFHEEYEDVIDNPSQAKYIIKKRMVHSLGQPFCEDQIQECSLSYGKVLVSVDSIVGDTEHGPCTGKGCGDCKADCILDNEVCFPCAVADRAPIRYLTSKGQWEYGIHLNFDRSQWGYEYYVIPFEGSMLSEKNYDQWWGGHWHEHIPFPLGEEVSVDELSPEHRNRYESFLLWLNDHFTENYEEKT